MHQNGAVHRVLRIRSIIAFLFIALALCAIGLRGARSQSSSVRRITNTTEEAVNLNPSLSGDGRRIAFESTEDLARAGGSGGFRALRANLSATTVSFTQMGMTRAVAPAISQDGSRIAFSSKDNPLGTNADGNPEIFFYDGSLHQVTNTSPGDVTQRLRNGSFQPSITDDGRYIAFSSNRTLAGLNGDNNLDIFIYDTTAGTFTQLTNTAGNIGATDAKISGDGSTVAYIRDSGTIEGSPRDLVLQPRAGGAPQVIADNIVNISMTYGRAISDNGRRVVYSAPGGVVNALQVFLYDGQNNTTRQITSLGAPEEDGDVPLHPSISGNGLRLSFATRRNVIGGNSDDSVELYTYNILTGQTARITSAPSSADAAVVSSLSDDGSLVAFNFPRVLSGDVSSSANANNCEIYTAPTIAGTPGSDLTILNGASFGHEPAEDEAVAPDSVAVAIGTSLSNVTAVTVNGRPAEIINSSPGLVMFHVPAATELGTAQVVITHSGGQRTRGTVAVKAAAPGVFTRSGDGTGEGVVVDAATGRFGPFDPTGGTRRLIVSATGVRNASEVSVTIGGRLVTVEAITPSPTMPGRDEIRILLPADLSGAGTVDLVVRADDRASNPVKVTISGRARRDIIINEVLADPPLELAGDANHDGVRDSSDDEFVELVNSSTRDIDISGYELLSRSESAAGDTVRHIFAPGTIFPAGTAIVVFGGGSPPVNSPVFGGAQVFKASKNGSSSSLSLSNSGGTITVREPSGAIVTVFTYGDSNGLNADEDQSLTRSPDISGQFVLHTTAPNSGGRLFSPGTRVDGTRFAPTPAIARIVISPTSARIGTGARLQFTARAYGTNGRELTGVIFHWTSSAPAVASIDQNGLATAKSPGRTQIRASARGVQSNTATLTVFFQAQVLTRVEVTPSSVSLPPGGQQQFTARAIDQNGNEITGVTFVWSSSNEAVATVDQSGLATAHSLGTAIISATAQGKTGSATLKVVAPVIVINELLADPPGSDPDDLEGDANHDGVRDSGDDEFVEIVNSSNVQLNISGWTLSTRSVSEPTERIRHTFAAGTTLPARAATVVFGGGNFDPANPVFACAQVFKASSGRLSLTNTSLHVMVRDSSGKLFAQLTYGSGTGLDAGEDQSLTRSPDVTGNFVLHTEADGAGGRRFSPGTKVNGTPLGPCQGRLTSVTISPTSASVIINQTIQFTAQALDQFGQPLTGVNITFTSSNTSVATIESVTINPSTGVATATVRGRRIGTTQITARATDGTTTVASSPATLRVIPVPPRVTRIEVTPESATINRGQTQQFTVKAFNQDQPVSGVTYTWTSSNEAVATVNQNGLATGVGIGTVTITATAPDGQGGTVSDSAMLTVQIPLIINEILADVPSDNEGTPVIEGDANRDGVRDSGDDEFIELFNNTASPVDISGVTISDATRVRFTFPANTVLAAGRAVVVFGGGEPPPNDPNFGGSLVLKASSLGLNDSGDTVTLKLAVGGTDVTFITLKYGTGGTAPAPSDRSLTRSPDAEVGTPGGDYVAHTVAVNAAGRNFSPGTRTDGTPFGSPPITRITVTPASATLNIGGTRTFTARAFSNAGGPQVEVLNVSFIWDVSDPNKARVAPTTGRTTTATALQGGTVTIRARAGGQQGTATLKINFPPVARVVVTPATARIPVGGTQQFTARAYEANNQEIKGLTFTWTSSNPNVATVDQNGLATGVGVGQTIITASAGGKSDSSTLNVVARTVVINEVLADPPDGIEGDANRDGVRDTDDDEFVELVNALNAAVNISGWSIRTRSETATSETIRHRFAANTTLPAGRAIVVFGGGTFNPNNPAFGGSQVVKASTGRLALTNTGLTVSVRDAAGNLVAQLTYGGSTGLNGGASRSLTRSPDITGPFTLHTSANNADGRLFSPGTRTDGTPFGSPPVMCIVVTPASDAINVGETRTFTGHAYSTADCSGAEIQNVSFIWDSSDPSKASVSPTTGRTTTATAHQGGTVTIRARAGGQQDTATLTINFPPVTRVEVTPESATIPVGGTQQFTAQAFDQNNQVIVGMTFTWTSSDETVATVDQNGLATGVGVGTTTITASAGGHSDSATLNVVARTVVINEVLADPPGTQSDDLEGDANRDGVRSGTDDEFVELVNALNTSVNISGWTLRTRSLNNTNETTRHTFAANTTLPAGQAIVVFGGGTPNPADPAFGGAQVVLASSGALVLTNGGLHVIVRDASGNLVAQFTYGGSTGLEGDQDQSLTRSPDITGQFVLHMAAAGSNGSRFSPGTRVDGTPFGPPALSINNVSMNEGDGGATTFTFTVQLSFPATAGGVTFDIATADGTAQDDNPTTEDDDYEPKSLTNQTIPEGSQTYTFDVTVNGDTTNEPDETFFVNVTNVTGATVADGQGQGTILNDDSPQLSINDVTMAEGDAGATIFTFTVHSTQPAPAGGITFDIATADGTAQDDNPATEDDDYEPKSLTNQTIPEGDQDYTFQVTVNGDTFVEPDETFTVNLSNVTNAGIADGQGIGTITNDDVAVVVISQVYGGGGNAGSFYKNDFIEIFNRGNTIVDISGWSVQYRPPTTTTGNWSVTNLCNPTTAGTCVLQPGQYYLVQEAAGTSATGGTEDIDEDIAGTIDLGATGGKVALVNNTTSLGTATCPIPGASVVDFVGYGNANCFEGSAAAPAPSNTNADLRKGGGCVDTDNNQADFFVHTPFPRNSDSPLNTCNAGQTTDIFISDATPVNEGNSGTVPATFTVSLATPSASTVTVDYATADGTANAPADYTAIPTTQLIFNPGETSKTVTVQVKGDTVDEADETFFVNLTNASNAAIVDGQGRGTITDDDAPPVLTVSNFSAIEGDGGTTTFTFTVQLSAPAPASGVTFDIATQDDTATDADNDYEPKSLSNQTIPSGETDYIFEVTVNGDTTDELNETFFVNVTNVTGATVGDGQGVGTIQNDDSPPVVIDHIEVTPTSATITVGGTQQFTARAFDASNNEIPGVTFTWDSSNPAVATIDQNGLATGISAGTTQITASSGGVTSNAATLTVARKPNAFNDLVINEVLARTDTSSTGGTLNGDANKDGDSTGQRDEFVEIINHTSVTLDLTGLRLYDNTTTTRHIFPNNTFLQPGKAIIVFGGENGTPTNSGIPDIADNVDSRTNTATNPTFGGAIVQVASTFNLGTGTTSALQLNDTGAPVADAIRIVDGTITSVSPLTVNGTLIAQATFPASTVNRSFSQNDNVPPVETGGNRDFTASDIHPQVTNPSSIFNGKFFSPGFKRDGVTPF